MGVIRIAANVPWEVWRDPCSQNWVGACEPLKVTARGETYGDLCQMIAEIHSELFADLLEEGELPRFLVEHGWQPMTPLPLQLPDEGVKFDVPFQLIAAANAEARAAHQ